MSEQPCGHYVEHAGECGVPTSKMYLTGWRCPVHTPAALGGRPEATPDPALTLRGRRLAAGVNPDSTFTTSNETVVDARAKASGKRRSTPQDYRTAQAVTGKEHAQ